MLAGVTLECFKIKQKAFSQRIPEGGRGTAVQDSQQVLEPLIHLQHEVQMKTDKIQKSFRVTGCVLPLCDLPQKESSLMYHASGLNHRLWRWRGSRCQQGHQIIPVARG